ncbi:MULTISPECIES: glycosyltransferase family 4 protein [unclassified Sphingomonas]|uniref:glycosyltransferase family 4 protein n=1 Tax=unclassified Sphingomonas TaxID=196159 RepID=UPI00082CB5A2|nr:MULTISPECIES: glycosyltransferase family 1 protein [unclassified Sphingomonas]
MNRVAVDHRTARWREGTGVARYRAGLADALARVPLQVEPIGDGGDAAARPGWRDVRRMLHGRPAATRSEPGWLVPDLYRLAQRRFTAIGALTELALPDPPAIVHWSHPVPIHVVGAANLYTIHDLIPLTHPELTGIAPRRHRRLLKRLIGVTAQFVTVSETVRAELCAQLALPADRVSCCYQAVEPGSPGALPAGLASGAYLLVVGRVESRKNVEALLHAHRRAETGLPLVIAGPDGHWRDAGERRRVEILVAAPDVIRLGWQDDATIAALIAGARALLMPSLAEGFGLPVVEAMALGVPALASAHGAAAEIAGDAALLVDPQDAAALADAIRLIVRDAPLRTGLIAKGQGRAAQFTAESFAARLAALYERFW